MEQQIARLDNPHFKGAVAINLDDVIVMNRKTFPTYLIEICKEIIFLHRIAIYFQKDSHFVNQVDGVIAAIQTNGLISHWEKAIFDKKYLTRPEPTNIIRNLNLEQLLGCFKIFLMGLFFSIFVFVLECLSLKFLLIRHVFIWIRKYY